MAVKDPFELEQLLNRGFMNVSDDLDVAMEVFYIGSSVDGVCTVEVLTTTGDLEFVVDGAADTTIQIGATPGTIDVSDTDADTIGEVADHINASKNWRCVVKDALKSDPSTVAMLLTMAATSAKTEAVQLYKDTTATLNLTIALTEQSAQEGIVGDQDTYGKVYAISATSTYGSGTSLIKVYNVLVDKWGVVNSETEIYSAAAGATTALKEISFGLAGLKPLTHDLGYKLVIRLVNSAAMASASLQIDAEKFRFPRG